MLASANANPGSLPGAEPAATERQPNDEDHLPERDQEKLLIPLGQVLGCQYADAETLRTDPGGRPSEEQPDVVEEYRNGP
nr:hypothetical protein [Plantactinospora alkalitolerans]